MKKLLLIPLAVFVALYSWRFATDAWLDPVPLRYLAINIYATYIFGISFAGLLAGLCLDREELENVNSDMLIAAFLVSALVLLKVGTLTLTGSEGRLESGITGPIGLGHVAASGLLICLCILGAQPVIPLRAGLIATTAPLCLFLLIRAASRSPIVALIFVSVLLLVCSVISRNIKMLSVFLCAGMLASVAAYTLKPDETANTERIYLHWENYFNLDTSSGRDVLFPAAWEQFKAHPWTGNALEEQDVGDHLYYPHNIFIEAFMSTGIFGGIALAFTGLLGLGIALWIFCAQPHLSWLAAVHLQLLTLANLSGCVATSCGYWFTLGTMLCCLRKSGTMPSAGKKRL